MRKYNRIAIGILLVIVPTLAAVSKAGEDSSPTVSVVIGVGAPELQQYAADEMCGYLKKLYGICTDPTEEIPDNTDFIILIGNPTTNSSVARVISKDGWPDLTDQGIVLKRINSNGKPALIVGGGSPKATLWAVYELVERFGVRYLLDQDVLPRRSEWIELPDLNVVMEPNMRIRCWRLINDLANGPVSWSLEENLRFLRQMAKMKYNRIHTRLWPHQPFVHYTFRGMEKPPGSLYFGQRHPINDDTIGREKFQGMSVYTNPEFIGADSPAQVRQRAVALVKSIHQEARRLGMQTIVSFEPFNWPKEFLAMMPAAQHSNQLGNLIIQPGDDQPLDDPLLREMVTTVMRAYIETYPTVDFIQVCVPEKRRWLSQGRQAYERLDKRYDLSDLGSYEELCARARSRTSFPGGGARVEKMVKGDLAILWLLDSIVREGDILKRPDGGPDIKLNYSGVTSELFPLVARITPPRGEVVSFIDYTASRVLRRRDLVRQIPSKDVPVSLILTLADDNVGVLPQLATGSFHKLMADLRDSGWAGFYTRYWTVGEQDPAIHYLARASWDAEITPHEAYTDQVEHVCGSDAVESALEAFALLEKITLRLDQHGLGFGFPVPGMMSKHYKSGGLSAAIKQDHQFYREALKLMEEAQQQSRLEGHDYVNYFVGRLRFAVRYLDAAEAYGATALAEKANKPEKARRYSEVAYQAIREALQTYADVAKDHGDLGAVALMNEFCYRPIRDKRNQLTGVSR